MIKLAVYGTAIAIVATMLTVAAIWATSSDTVLVEMTQEEAAWWGMFKSTKEYCLRMGHVTAEEYVEDCMSEWGEEYSEVVR